MRIDIRKAIARQQAQDRAMFAVLAKLYPGAFTKDGKPLVAVLKRGTP